MTTACFAVVGNPIAHSASPRLHAAAYRSLGMNCVYEALETTEDELPAVVARLRRGELGGLNVTIPHKARVLSLVDSLDESARAARAANTLVRTAEGHIVAYNTDVAALAEELAELTLTAPQKSWSERHALVLGTGATARSAVLALGRDLGVRQITVRGRAFADEGKEAAFRHGVVELLTEVGCRAEVACEPWRPCAATERSVDVIVQATSLGMAGGGDGAIARDVVLWNEVRSSAAALDVVYGPSPTVFVQEALTRKLRAADGRGMLARQGAIAFALWFRATAPLAAMRAALDD